MSDCKTERKWKKIFPDEMVAIIQAVVVGAKKTQATRDYNVTPNKLSAILSIKEAITDAIECGVKGTGKKLQSPAFQSVEKAVFRWFLDATATTSPVRGQMKARNFAHAGGCRRHVTRWICCVTASAHMRRQRWTSQLHLRMVCLI